MTREPTHFVGVDWASGAWVTVVYSSKSDRPDIDVFDTIREVWDEYGEASHRIVVDVPIGLCESFDADDCPCEVADGEIFRACDSLARSVIGDRYRSVFTSPARQAARMAADGDAGHAEITEKNKDLTGKGLTQQAAGIASGIVATEDLLLGDGDSDVLVEGHPEVCFRAFNGKPLEHSKKTAPGVDERLSAISSVQEYTPDDWRVLAKDLRTEDRRVQLDDLLDALVLALTAFAKDDEYKQLPPDPPTDANGLPMQMVYRSRTDLVE
ncbi:DUF429 domain-containing protein [Halocalculus aciditolerans]|uniref:DUF429 domain-containing protein n=1 Tax=Halocalculus aciditolerans TaxID=1383812 RepID=A0A830F856_9EURY|nr:DUF429 domain-containing protein [Halocalculus aciditolerans]GGL64168.1 hypothetical protein GCM10009039_22520 [Halocalculus aciditolerans]